MNKHNEIKNLENLIGMLSYRAIELSSKEEFDLNMDIARALQSAITELSEIKQRIQNDEYEL